MSVRTPNLPPFALRLIGLMLNTGGFCTVTLAQAALESDYLRTEPAPDVASVRRILGSLLAAGFIRKVALLRPKDSTTIYQTTRRAARIAGKHAPYSTRSGPSDGQIWRGLARFWFETTYLPKHLSDPHDYLPESIAFPRLDALGIPIPLRWPVGDTYVRSPDGVGLNVYFIFGSQQDIGAGVRQAFLRYQDGIPLAKIGFVVDSKRAPQLKKLLAEMCGTDTDPGTNHHQLGAELAAIQASLSSASTSIVDRMNLQARLNQLQDQLQAETPTSSETGGLSDVILPTVVHDLY